MPSYLGHSAHRSLPLSRPLGSGVERHGYDDGQRCRTVRELLDLIAIVEQDPNTLLGYASGLRRALAERTAPTNCSAGLLGREVLVPVTSDGPSVPPVPRSHP